jgi:F-type H+-transporting ATPase subunit b
MEATELKLADVPPGEHPPPPPPDDETPPEQLHTSTEQPGDGHGAKPGLPQLDQTTFASQLFWLLISFVVLYVVISRFAAPKIGGVIEGRASRIRSDVNAAGEAQRAGEEAIQNYERALTEARGRALKLSEQIRATVQAEINSKGETAAKQLAADLQKAEARVAQMRANAMARVGDVAREATADIVARLTGEMPTVNEVDDAVAAALGRR